MLCWLYYGLLYTKILLTWNKLCFSLIYGLLCEICYGFVHSCSAEEIQRTFFFKNFDWERMYRLKIRNAVIWDSLNCDLKQHRMYLYQSNTYRSHDGLNNNHLKHNVRSLQTDRVLDYPWLKAAGGGGEFPSCRDFRRQLS